MAGVCVVVIPDVFSSLRLDTGTAGRVLWSSSSSSLEKLGLGEETKLLQINCMESTFFKTVPKLSFGSSSVFLFV